MQKASARFKFISGFVFASLLFRVGAVAVNVNNTPEGGYLLCANKKTRAVTFPGTLRCPSGTVEIFIPGTNSDITLPNNSSSSSSNPGTTNNSSNSNGNVNCNLTYLQNNPNQISTVVPQCSTSQLSKLQTDLSNFDRESQARLDDEIKKGQALQKEAEAKKGTAGAQAAADAVAKQSALVAELMAKTKNNIAILASIVNEIAKKVKG